MSTTTTRRAFLKAAPPVAAMAALPVPALAFTDDGWDRVKARYHNAIASRDALAEAHNAAEARYFAFSKEAPEATITYTVEGFTSDNGLVELKGHHARKFLGRNNWNGEYLAPELKAHPDYIAFAERMKAWERDPARIAAERAFEASDVAFCEACESASAAWDAVAQYPVTTAAQAHEKIALLVDEADGEGEWLDGLLRAVQADLARVAGEA